MDDESHVVNWLVELFQSQQDMELDVLKANTGMAALALLDRQRVDVVLLDIKMPGLSGLDVADRISENWPACKIIFFTGHSDFSYLYTVNKKGNATYLLKTEDDTEIFSAVRNAIEALEVRGRQDTYLSEVQQNERFSQHIIKREIFRRVLAGKPFEETLSLINWPGRHQVFDQSRPVFLIFGKIRWKSTSEVETGTDTHVVQMEHIIESVLDHRFEVAMIDLDAVTVTCFLQQRQPSSEHMVSGFLYLKESLDGMVNQCAKAIEGHVAFLLHDREMDWAETSIAYERMAFRFQKDMHAEVFSHSFGSLYHEAESSVLGYDAGACISDVSGLTENLSHHLNQGNRSDFMQILGKIAQQMMGKCNMTQLHAIRVYQSIVLVFLDYITRYHLQEKIADRIPMRGLYNLESPMTDGRTRFTI